MTKEERKGQREQTREEARRGVLAEIAREIEAKHRTPETPERIALAYRRVFEGPDGEIVLADLKAKFNGSCVRIRPAGIDPYEVVYREGQRDLYLYLVESMTPPPSPQSIQTEDNE